ncbi:hypothetical protein KSP40_PGU000738 [Platanthera guangdongensis]|uniref:RNase H type-1 domain-containing protein n=1 Tax=Platanthera guangdongensis TaxID=2320717 RepID=A0ABR2MKM2_9ASPA
MFGVTFFIGLIGGLNCFKLKSVQHEICDCFDASGVIIEGDCLNLIKYCQRCFDSRLWDAHFPDADVLGFLFELPRVLLRYAPREINRAADFCSRYAISCTFLWTYFEDFPPVLSEVVQSDRDTSLFLTRFCGPFSSFLSIANASFKKNLKVVDLVEIYNFHVEHCS